MKRSNDVGIIIYVVIFLREESSILYTLAFLSAGSFCLLYSECFDEPAGPTITSYNKHACVEAFICSQTGI